MEEVRVIPLRSGQILLGVLRDAIDRETGVSRYSAFGGNVEKHDSRVMAARLLKEQSGLAAMSLDPIGRVVAKSEGITFLNTIIFLCSRWMGGMVETDDFQPKWCQVNHIPYSHLPEDYYFWLPFLIKREKFEGTFTFDEKGLSSIFVQILPFTEGIA